MPRSRGHGPGSIETLRSGRHRATFRPPQGDRQRQTFNTRRQAEVWLAAQQADVARGVWLPPRSDAPTFLEYATTWIATRRNRSGQPLAPRTAEDYRRYLGSHLVPLHPHPIDAITPHMVAEVYASMDGKPSAQANCYGLLCAIFNTAVADDLLTKSPCRVKGGLVKVPKAEVVILTPAEIVALAEAMPANLRALVLLTTWDTLRQGEGFELRRSDVAPDCSTVRVRRGVTYTRGQKHIRGPKSEAGKREVAVPPHLRQILADHMALWTNPEADALVFTSSVGNQLRASTLYRHFYKARASIGQPGLKWHHLRHTGGTMAAQAGATLGELMALLGHSTVKAAMVYQHMAGDRGQELADRLSAMAESGKPALRVVG